MNTENLKECSRLLRESTPKKLISSTVDPNEGLSWIQRQQLFFTELKQKK